MKCKDCEENADDYSGMEDGMDGRGRDVHAKACEKGVGIVSYFKLIESTIHP